MTEEQVKRISELYKTKSDLLSDLSKLTGIEHSFNLSYYLCDTIHMYGPTLFNCSKLLSKEIKEIVLLKLQLEIDKIDLELTNIKC